MEGLDTTGRYQLFLPHLHYTHIDTHMLGFSPCASSPRAHLTLLPPPALASALPVFAHTLTAGLRQNLALPGSSHP